MFKSVWRRSMCLVAGVMACTAVHAGEDGAAWDVLQSAGLTALPILTLSLLSLAVIFERLAHCKSALLSDKALFQSVLPKAQNGHVLDVLAMAKERPSVLGRSLCVLLVRRDAGEGAASQAAADVAAHALRAHQQKIYALAVVATVAPILGLLGTVFGMIDAFHVVSAVGLGDPSALADGIAKALVNTALGLCVALPSLLAYHFFKHRIASEALRTEQHLRELAQCVWVSAPKRQE